MASSGRRFDIVPKGTQVSHLVRQLNDWVDGDVDDAIRDGLESYANAVTADAYANTKLPSKGRKDPAWIGYRYGKTRKPFWGPQRSRVQVKQWLVKIQPQYIAHWQEWGTKAHNLVETVDPKAQLNKRYWKVSKKLDRDKARFQKHLAEGTVRGKKRVGKRVWEGFESIDRIKRMYADPMQSAVVGYDATKPFRPDRKNRTSDWLKHNERPATVRPGRKFMHGGTQGGGQIASAAKRQMAEEGRKMFRAAMLAYGRRKGSG